MKTLTIFTPAYNRAHTLSRTYESLLRQTCDDFEWLIVDDGSKDSTKALVEGWIQEGKISIWYIYQQNQGMHGAHNTAYRNIHTELNTCIDSDDYMPDNAVETIINFWKAHGSDKYAGIIGLDCTENGNIIGTSFPEGMTETTLNAFYAKGGKGDKKLVYRTDVIKQYPEYPIFEGEKYVSLGYKYLLIDQDYPLLTLNKPLVVVEYQQDGSSMNMYRQYWNNPKGFAFIRKVDMKLCGSLKRKFESCIHYVSSSIRSKNTHFIAESPLPGLTILAIIPGIILYFFLNIKIPKTNNMKIVYCTDSICYLGGIQNVTITKANGFAQMGHQVWIIVTDNKYPPLHPIDPKVQVINLDINYFEDDWKSKFYVIKSILIKRKQHKKAISKLLNEIKPNVVISTGTSEKNF